MEQHNTLWGSCSDVKCQSEFELTKDTSCSALTDEPWDVCYEDPVVMQYINPTFELTRDTPCIALADRTGHGMSVVMILAKIDHAMAAPHFVNKICRGTLDTHGTILCDFCLSGSVVVYIDYCFVYCLCVVSDNTKYIKNNVIQHVLHDIVIIFNHKSDQRPL